VGLASCNKSDDLVGNGPEETGSKVVALGISNQTLTKALTDAIQADHKVKFDGGYIVFTDQGDRITNVFNLINDDTAVTPSTGTDKDNPLSNGDDIIIELLEYKDPVTTKQVNYFFEVNSDARYVHVFGNTDYHDLVFTSSSNGVIDTYLSNFAVGAKDLYSGGNVAHVPLYGVGTIQEYADGPGNFSDNFSGEVDKIAQVKISPIASRLELAKMTADATKLSYTDTNTGTTYTLDSYELEAIFLNYFHKGMAYNGKIVSSTGFVAFNSLDDFKEDGSSTDPWYNFTNRNIFHDYNANTGIATTTGMVTVPYDSKEVWAYNMFQASAQGSQEPQEALPHLVLKLKPTITKNPVAGPDFPGMDSDGYSYITVRRYMEKLTDNVVSAFEGGYVYYIEDLLFGIENLKEVPEWREPMTVEVMFKIMNWDTKEVYADLD